MVDKFGPDHIITVQEICQLLVIRYRTTSNSIIPSDYCYNRINNGIQIDKRPAVFEFLGKDLYRCLELNYPYNGMVYHKPKGQPEIVIGKCINGIRIIAPCDVYDFRDINVVKQLSAQRENQIPHRTVRQPSMRLRYEVLKRDNFNVVYAVLLLQKTRL